MEGTRLIRALGRRGVVLGLLGLVWIFTGVSILVTPGAHNYLMLDIVPPVRASAWVIAGLVAIACAGLPQGDDRWGFAALYIPALYRFLAYLYGFEDWIDDAHGRAGDPRALVGVLAWGTVLILLVVIAGWREPDDTSLHESHPR